MKIVFLNVFLVVCCVWSKGINALQPSVDLPYGKFIGRQITTQLGNDGVIFLGIPFVKVKKNVFHTNVQSIGVCVNMVISYYASNMK